MQNVSLLLHSTRQHVEVGQAIACAHLVVPGSCTGEWREHKHNPTGAGPAVLASRQSRFGDSNLPGPRRDPLHTHSFALYLHSTVNNSVCVADILVQCQARPISDQVISAHARCMCRVIDTMTKNALATSFTSYRSPGISLHAASAIKGKLNAKNKYGLSEGELGTDSDELCLEPIREEELCQIS